MALKNELELIEKAKGGDTRSFDILMDHHYDYLYNIARRYTDYTADTEEVVQEAMLKVWLNLPKFRGDSKLSTWLFIICANAAKKNLTSRHRIPSHPHNQTVSYSKAEEDSDDDFSMFDDHHSFGIDLASPESEHNAVELAALIFDIAETLPKDLYDALYLREIELMSYEDISTTLDIPLGTTKSRLFNARTELNAKLNRRLGIVSNDINNRFEIGY